MKLSRNALLSLLLVSTVEKNRWTVASFAPTISGRTRAGAVVTRRQTAADKSTGCIVTSQYLPTLSSRRRRHQRQQQLTRRWAARDDEGDEDEEDDDDDEDDEFEYDDDEEPLSAGINSVSWLPAVIGAKASGEALTQRDSEIIPLFPLGGIVYTPNSQHILNIFEPRYREMYNAILMNGTKRFAVSMSHPTEKGRFAQMAVLFELEDLKEVSEQTADQIKYICNHKVTGRVKLHRILNPEAWTTRTTYLRAEGTIVDDSGKDASQIEADNVKEQKLLRSAFADLVELQHDLQEDVRFTRPSVVTLAVKPGAGEDGLWQTIKLWQTFADQRLMQRQNELQRDFQEKLQEYLKKEKGLKGELPRYVSHGTV
jgi:Lon protease-like protein